MPPRKLNPIAEKLWRMVHSGKTTKEKICVAADLKYPTLENVFTRQTISYATLKSLKYAEIISEKDEADYKKWISENLSKKKKEGSDATEIRDSNDQFEEPNQTAEGVDGPEVFNTTSDV